MTLAYLMNMWGICKHKPIELLFREPIPNIKVHRTPDGRIIEMFSESNQDLPVEKIGTLSGWYYAVPGEDYIIQGVNDLYPIKKDVFIKIYDIVKDA